MNVGETRETFHSRCWLCDCRRGTRDTSNPEGLSRTLIQSGNHKVALDKIQAGADVNEAQPDGSTPVLWAVVRIDYDVLDALIAKKANVEVANQFGATPLLEAAKLADARIVKALLAAGAKVDSANLDGETALMVAIKTGDLPIVESLVSAGANVNTIEKFHDQTPLMYAAASNKNAGPMVKLLLSKGANVKPRAKYSDWPSQVTSEPRTQYRATGGLNALLYASRSGCYSCVEDLIAAGADVNLPTPEGVTALMIALDNDHNDVAKLLLEKGANPHVWDWWGRTALYIAVDARSPRTGAAGAGAGAGGRGGQGRGAAPGPGATLGGAAARGPARPAVSGMDIINALLDAGVDPNPELNMHRPNGPKGGRFADNQLSTGCTPLFRAALGNDTEVIQALLTKGANPNMNSMGYNAFLLAAGAGPGGRGGNGGGTATQAILDLMVQHNADVNAKVTGTKLYSMNVSRAQSANEGTTALHTAAQAGNINMVRFLLEHGASPNILDANGKKPIDLVGVRAGGPAGAPGAAPAKPAAAAGAPTPLPGGGGGGRAGGGAAGASPATLAEIRTLLQDAASKK